MGAAAPRRSSPYKGGAGSPGLSGAGRNARSTALNVGWRPILSVMQADDPQNLRAATMKLHAFIDELNAYGDVGPDAEQAARLIVDQQAAADTCVAVFQATVRQRMMNSQPDEKA